MQKILVVDDSKPICDIMANVFKKAGHQGFFADDGEKGLALAFNILPDLIILDIRLPILNGFEVCRILKKNSKTQAIPILFLTGHYKEAKDAVQGLELGAYDYIRKPFELEEFIARMNVLLKIKEQQDQIAQLLIIDPFKSVFNEKILTYHLNKSFAMTQRYKTPLSLILIKIDGFKNSSNINVDELVVNELQSVVEAIIGTEDFSFRSENNEFIVLIHDLIKKAYFIAQNIKNAIDKRFLELSKTNDPFKSITVRIAVTRYLPYVAETKEKLIDLARAALQYSIYSQSNKITCIPNEDIPQSRP